MRAGRGQSRLNNIKNRLLRKVLQGPKYISRFESQVYQVYQVFYCHRKIHEFFFGKTFILSHSLRNILRLPKSTIVVLVERDEKAQLQANFEMRSSHILDSSEFSASFCSFSFSREATCIWAFLSIMLNFANSDALLFFTYKKKC